MTAMTNHGHVAGMTHWQSPNFFAYFPANSSFPGILGEMMSAAFNIIGFSWRGCPAATDLETVSIQLPKMQAKHSARLELSVLPPRSKNDTAIQSPHPSTEPLSCPSRPAFLTIWLNVVSGRRLDRRLSAKRATVFPVVTFLCCSTCWTGLPSF
jgi:hypothetical protein